jgi:hypothetical protein
MIQSKKKNRKIRLKVVNKTLVNFCECGNEDPEEFNKDFELAAPGEDFKVSLVCKKCKSKECMESMVMQCKEIQDNFVT